MMHHYFYGPSGDYGLPFAGVVFVLFWVLVALLAIVVWRRTNGFHAGWHVGVREPLEYLKERYAKGEITKEEFDRVKKDLLA